MTTPRYPETRTASAQAWRRLRKTMSEGELRDIARDIAKVARAERPELPVDLDTGLYFALVSYPWDEKDQA